MSDEQIDQMSIIFEIFAFLIIYWARPSTEFSDCSRYLKKIAKYPFKIISFMNFAQKTNILCYFSVFFLKFINYHINFRLVVHTMNETKRYSFDWEKNLLFPTYEPFCDLNSKFYWHLTERRHDTIHFLFLLLSRKWIVQDLHWISHGGIKTQNIFRLCIN